MSGLEIAALALSAASAVAGTVGAISQANAQRSAATYQAQIADRNAILARRQAAQKADDHALENRRTLSAIRAAYGTSGLSMEGSPLDVLENAAVDGQLDINRALYKGAVNARNEQERAIAARATADAASPVGGIVSSVFRAGGSIVGMYLRPGGFGAGSGEASSPFGGPLAARPD